MQLFVGLGNPGNQYEGNRHNVGFMAIDAIAEAFRFPAFSAKFQGRIAKGRIGGEDVVLFKPETFMNESGRAVQAVMTFHKIKPAKVTVLHDELDVAGGRIRIKRGGGHGGHNGLRSIDAHVGQDYRRVRIGIGHPGDKDRVVGHVLNDFSKAEQVWLPPLLKAIADSAEALVDSDDAGVMNRVALAMKPHLDKLAPEINQAAKLLANSKESND
ncbi:MAG: aminoacyl-tRNA hydrolase [Rhodospirillales bacterium]